MDAGIVFGQYRLLLRMNRQFWFANLFVGFGFPLLLQAVLATRIRPEGHARLLIGNALLALLMVTFRPSCFLPVFDRLTGRLALLATTPLTRRGYLAAIALDGLAMTLLPLAVLAAGVAFLEVPPPGSLSFVPVLLLTGAVLSAAGLWLSSFLKSLPATGLVANAATMFAVAFCPLAYPMERVPSLLVPLVSVLPQTLCAEATAASWTGDAVAPWRLAALAAWGVALGAAAYRAFPWTGDR